MDRVCSPNTKESQKEGGSQDASNESPKRKKAPLLRWEVLEEQKSGGELMGSGLPHWSARCL